MVDSIILVGDSILDNFYWLEDKKKDLTYDLEKLGYNVVNFAVDESRLTDVINGIKPREQYSSSRPYPYITDKDGFMRPLSLINKWWSFDISVLNEISTNTTFSKIIVLSVGGNDLRTSMLYLLSGMDTFFDKVFTKEYIDNYNNLLSELLGYSDRMILVQPYLPYLGESSNYKIFEHLKNEFIRTWFDFTNDLAKKYNIPLLDLSKTFDPYDRSHYGSTEIEPSNKSSLCIANCISHINKNYEGYKIYYAPNCGEIKIL